MKPTAVFFLIVLSMLVLMTGCADTHNLVRSNPTGITTKLTPKDSFYIAVSKDVVYGEDKNEGSGLSLSQILQSSIAKRARRVEMGTSHQTFDDALLYARSKSFKYLIYPTILHFEDHATEWNGVPDRVEIKVEVVESTTERLVDSALIDGRSGLGTFGGDKPQDLLPIPIEEFVSGLF
jgi:hypothetical protein